MSRAMHVCSTAGCPVLVATAGRCPVHERATDRARGTTAERGYGQGHVRERRKWAPQVEAGLVDCARCGWRIRPGEAWDLGHTDDRKGWRGPEHAPCNRSAAGKAGHG